MKSRWYWIEYDYGDGCFVRCPGDWTTDTVRQQVQARLDYVTDIDPVRNSMGLHAAIDFVTEARRLQLRTNHNAGLERKDIQQQITAYHDELWG